MIEIDFNDYELALIQQLADSRKTTIPELIKELALEKMRQEVKVLTFEEIIQLSTPVFKSFDFVQEAYLFGSYARGEATGKSDVDFMIIPNTKPGLSFFGIFEPLEEALGKKVDVILESEAADERFKAVHRDKVKIYERK